MTFRNSFRVRLSWQLAVLGLFTIGMVSTSGAFSIVKGVLLQGFPYPEPQRILYIERVSKSAQGEISGGLKVDTILALQRSSQTLQAIGVFHAIPDPVEVAVDDLTQAGVCRISSGVIDVLGVRPIRGRNFTPQEDFYGQHRVAIVSHGFWQRRLGQADLPGLTVRFGGAPYQVVGVMPATFTFPEGETEIWIPPAYRPGQTDRDSGATIGRARAGVTPDRVKAEIASFRHKNSSREEMRVKSFRDYVLGDIGPALLALFGSALLLLFLILFNVAALLLVRIGELERSFAIRMALGATPWNIGTMFLSYCLPPIAAAGLLSWILLAVALRPFLDAVPVHIPRIANVQIDSQVFLFTLTLSAVVSLLLSAWSAFVVSQREVSKALGGRGSGSSLRSRRLHKCLVTLEIAFALALLQIGGSLAASFIHLISADMGFDPERIVSIELEIRDGKSRPTAQKLAWLEQAMKEIEAIPEISSAGFSISLPMRGGLSSRSFKVVGEPDRDLTTLFTIANEGYFRTMRFRLSSGRFSRAGTALTEVVVNESFAATYLRDTNPLGRRIQTDGELRVVGIVANVRQQGLTTESRPEIYSLPDPDDFGLVYLNSAFFVMKTDLPVQALVPRVRSLVTRLNSELRIRRVDLLEDLVAKSVRVPRFWGLLMTPFSIAGIVLAALGIYGLSAYSTQLRRSEFGIRLAMGANPSQIRSLAISSPLATALVGAALGMALSLALSRVLSNQLYGFPDQNPLLFLLAMAAMLVAFALLGCYWPARATSQIDPAQTLRAE